MNKKQKNDDVHTGVLTKEEIIKLGIIQLEKGQKEDEDCYSNASYDFRLGDEYFIPSIDNDIDSNTKDKKITQAEHELNCPYYIVSNNKKIKSCKDNNNVLRIKPFTSIVFSTYEKLKMPINVAGRFDLRIKWAMQGLVLQVGTQIEPGYEGRLFGLLHNFSKKELCIPTMERVLTAEFYYTSQDAPPIKKNKEEEEELLSLEKFISKFPAIDGTLENYLQEIRELKNDIYKRKEEIDKILRKRISWFTGIFIGIITLVLTVVVPLAVTKWAVSISDYPFRRVYEMETKEKELNKTIDILKKLTEELNTKMDSLQAKNGNK